LHCHFCLLIFALRNYPPFDRSGEIFITSDVRSDFRPQPAQSGITCITYYYTIACRRKLCLTKGSEGYN
ncbi:MAG: hypothetical protein ABIK23_03635, partial [candidate division WOR-3 bacterium]